MSLESLMMEWEKDSKIDTTEPGKELLRNPNLHSKYNTQLALHSTSLKAKRMAYNSARRFRSDYYQGRLSKEQLDQHGLQPFSFVLAKDVSLYLDADPTLQEIEKRIILHEEAVSFLLNVLKAINNRSFDIRGYIEWVKYTQGGGSA